MSHATVMSGLIAEAEALGAVKLTWVCDVTGWTVDPQRDGRWTCKASLADATLTVVDCVGRTGEEALREVVAFLRRVGA